MYIKVKKGTGARVQLTSASVSNAKGDYCLHFAYFGFGGRAETILVYHGRKAIYSSRGESPAKWWRNVAISISLTDSPSTVCYVAFLPLSHRLEIPVIRAKEHILDYTEQSSVSYCRFRMLEGEQPHLYNTQQPS